MTFLSICPFWGLTAPEINNFHFMAMSSLYIFLFECVCVPHNKETHEGDFSFLGECSYKL